MEKAAQYLKYADLGVSDIAYEVGFEDRAAFSKAFKKKYGYSPSAFRTSNQALWEMHQQPKLQDDFTNRKKIEFDIKFLPDFEYLFLEYRGDYEDISAIEEASNHVYNYVKDKDILTNRSVFMTEIVDDSEISDSIHLRYNVGFILDRPLKFELDGLFRIKKHKRQKYAKFTHKGTYQNYFDFFKKIYAYWMLDVALELEDLPTLEFYPNYDKDCPPEEMLTEIYIPVI